jgi:hypothetical protein
MPSPSKQYTLDSRAVSHAHPPTHPAHPLQVAAARLLENEVAEEEVASRNARNVVRREFACGYCSAIKTSKSEDFEGRVRIRCECGGMHQDGKSR